MDMAAWFILLKPGASYSSNYSTLRIRNAILTNIDFALISLRMTKDAKNAPIAAPPAPKRVPAPQPDGRYSEQVSRQAHRFWEGNLQFDYGKCCDDRGQMAGLFPEWSCARCLTVCMDQGVRRKQAVLSFYQKMSQLTQQTESFTASG